MLVMLIHRMCLCMCVLDVCAEYIRAKEARERDLEAEKERERSTKEHEISRLRAAQERAQDRQAAVDELRAKRYTHTHDTHAYMM